MNVIKFQNTIFIEENHPFKMATRARQNANHYMRLGCFWGYKFETISTLPDCVVYCTQDQIELREDEVVSNAAQWRSVVRSEFGKTKIVIGGEVDARK